MPSGILERGLLLRLRFELDHHVNLRPARLYPGVRSPLAGKPEIDMLVCARAPRARTPVTAGLRKDTPQEIATEVSVNTAYGVERVVRDAFARAERRPRKHLTLVHKTNVLTYAGALWSRLVEEVSLEHPDVAVAYQHIDAATISPGYRPRPLRRVVTDNLFGDIFTDLAAAVAGGIGLAASGNLDVPAPTPACSSRSTDARRTSPARATRTRPRRCCRSALLLDHLGVAEAAAAGRGRGRLRPRDPRPPGRGATPSRSATASRALVSRQAVSSA